MVSPRTTKRGQDYDFPLISPQRKHALRWFIRAGCFESANEQDRAQLADLVQASLEATGRNIQVTFVDQGYTGVKLAKAAAQPGTHLEAIKHHEARLAYVTLMRYCSYPISS